MAGGPVGYVSAIPLDAGNVFPNVYTSTTNNQNVETLGVVADLDVVAADATWQVWFPLPGSDPGGTLKVKIKSIAHATSTQSAYLRVLWEPIQASESIAIAEGSLHDEHSGGDLEIEHTAALDDNWVITKVTLDADTVVYGTDEFILMNIVMKNTSWDLDVVWNFIPELIWE